MTNVKMNSSDVELISHELAKLAELLAIKESITPRIEELQTKYAHVIAALPKVLTPAPQRPELHSIDVEQQINDAFGCCKKSEIFPFTGLSRVDNLLTGWSVYTDDNDLQIDTKDGPLYRLYNLPKHVIIKYLQQINWEQTYPCLAKGKCGCHLQLFKTWVADLYRLSQWILVYLVIEHENCTCTTSGYNLWNLAGIKL